MKLPVAILAVFLLAYSCVSCYTSSYMGDPRLMARPEIDSFYILKPQKDTTNKDTIKTADDFEYEKFIRLDERGKQRWYDSVIKYHDSIRHLKPSTTKSI